MLMMKVGDFVQLSFAMLCQSTYTAKINCLKQDQAKQNSSKQDE